MLVGTPSRRRCRPGPGNGTSPVNREKTISQSGFSWSLPFIGKVYTFREYFNSPITSKELALVVMKPPAKEVYLAEHRDNFRKQSLMGLWPTRTFMKSS